MNLQYSKGLGKYFFMCFSNQLYFREKRKYEGTDSSYKIKSKFFLVRARKRILTQALQKFYSQKVIKRCGYRRARPLGKSLLLLKFDSSFAGL